VFLIFTSFVMLGEFPDRSGMAGIFLIATGAYLLNLNSHEKGPLAPFKAIAKEKGALLIITVAFIYSISSNLGKIAVLHSSPIFFAVIYTVLLSVFILPFIVIRKRDSISAIRARPALFLLIGFIFAIMVAAHFSALKLTEVSYMISVKRTSLIFSVIYGWLIFKEEHIRERFLGSVVMVAGVVLITLF
jgi:drug/metabolite transporter (DMT)-like permease